MEAVLKEQPLLLVCILISLFSISCHCKQLLFPLPPLSGIFLFLGKKYQEAFLYKSCML
jgi:hypothetical protein